MTQADPFTWCDLSTFDVPAAEAFYSRLFGWSFSPLEATPDPEQLYQVAFAKGAPAAAVFPMPTALQALKLPSFWMSYIRIPDLDAALTAARAYPSATLEIGPLEVPGQGRIALLRDPAGAGFTLVEGPDMGGGTLRGGPADAAHGCLLWNELHLRNIETVRGFYRDVAGFEFRRSATDHPVFDVISAGGQKIATAIELPDAARGRYQYWMPVFGVSSLAQALTDVTEQGGAVLAQMDSTTALVQDNQGAGLLLRGK